MDEMARQNKFHGANCEQKHLGAHNVPNPEELHLLDLIWQTC